jgi:hypothetical protein
MGIDGETVMETDDLAVIGIVGLILLLLFQKKSKIEPLTPHVPVEDVTTSITYGDVVGSV